MKTFFFMLVLVCTFSCGIGNGKKSSDQANLQGTWLAQSESLNGIKKEVTFVYIFKDDKITFIDETGKEITYTFRLDTTSILKFIVIQPEEKLNISEPVSIAYELDGDSLKIVVAPPGLRPAEISDRYDQELITCKRKGS